MAVQRWTPRGALDGWPFSAARVVLNIPAKRLLYVVVQCEEFRDILVTYFSTFSSSFVDCVLVLLEF